MRSAIATIVFLAALAGSPTQSPAMPFQAAHGIAHEEGLILKVQQRRPPGGTSKNIGASDQTAGFNNGAAPNPVMEGTTPPVPVAPVRMGATPNNGRTQYGCNGPLQGWPVYNDNLGGANFTGGSCTFRSPNTSTAACPSGCGTYTYYDTKTVSVPGGEMSTGTATVNNSRCYSPSCYKDEFGTHCSC